MTYPLVRARETGGFFTSAAHNVPLPHSEPGDLLLIRIASDSGDSVTVPGVWDTLKNGLIPTNAFTDVVICKASVGTDYGEPTTVLIEVDPGEPITFIAESYQNWDGVTLPEISNGVAGSITDPDSESLTASWGADDNLFVTWFAMDFANRDVLGYPDDYLDERLEVHHPLAVAGGHQALYSASRNLASATDDPGPFNAVDDQWSAYTLVIRGTPTVLTLDVDSITAPIESGSTATIAGTEYGTLVSATQSGVAVPFSNATANSVDVDTLVIENTLLKYGPNLFTITNDQGESDSVYGNVIPLAGNSAVNLSGVLADTGLRITAIPDLVDADQLRVSDYLYENDGITVTPFPVTVLPNASISIGEDPLDPGVPPPNETYKIKVRAHSDSLGWGAESIQTFTVDIGFQSVSSVIDIQWNLLNSLVSTSNLNWNALNSIITSDDINWSIAGDAKDVIDATFYFTGVARDPLVTTALYAVAPAPADPGLLVYDDFSSETFTAPISGVNNINFSWKSGINVYLVKQPAAQPIQTSYLVGAITNIDDTNLNAPLIMPDGVTTRDWTDVNGVSGVSAMFRFRDEESDPTPAEINRPEITAHFDSQSEVWVNYRLRVPSNFSLNPLGNLDKMLAIYSDAYSGTGTGSTCWFDLGNDSSTPGSCRAYVAWSHGTGNGEPNEGTQAEYPDQQNGPVFATPADSGRWMEIAFHVKQESSIGANDGIVALYRKWEDVGTWETLVVATGLHIRESAVGDPGFQELYMVGPTSEGYPETYVEQTEWLIGSPYKLLSEPPTGLSQLPFSHDPAAGKVILDPNYDSTLNATYMADSGEDYKWNTISSSGTTISDDIPGYRGAYSFECFNTANTDGDNEFGGAYTPNFPEAGEGDIIRIQIPMYLPATFNGATNTGLLKFFRLHKSATSGGGHIGYIDVLISEALEQWHYGNEANTGDDATMTNYTYQKDRWELLEMHYKITATSALGNVRGFVNVDGVMTEIFNIDTETITDAAQVVDYFYLFTYWNGAPTYPATDQTCYIGEVAILVNNETDLTELSDTGIKVIGGAR